MTYLRCTIGRWNIDLSSDEGQETFRLINDEGLRVFRSQPGFIRYRLMVAEPTTTVAVAEWESEELGKPGAQRYREWLRSSGIAEKLSLETYDVRLRPECECDESYQDGGSQVDYGVHLPLISLNGQHWSLRGLLEYTEIAERLGFRALSVNDHLLFPRPWLRYSPARDRWLWRLR